MAVRAVMGASRLPSSFFISPVLRSCNRNLSRRSFAFASVAMASLAATAAPPSKKVLVPIAFGTEEIEASVIVDILRRAGADVLVASVEQDLQVEASRRVKLVADDKMDSCDGKKFDLIALPGGMPGASRLRDCAPLKKLTIVQSEQEKLVAAICAAPAVALQEWGLLDGRKATCHPSFIDKLSSSLTVGSRVQKDGHFITSRGPGTAIEFALALVEELYGKEKSEEIAKPLVLRSRAGNESTKENFNPLEWKASAAPRVLVPIANGSEEMEAVMIIDILRRAGMMVTVASVENTLQIEASRKVKIVADKLIEDVKDTSYDLIVLPGGMPGAERLRDCETLKTLLTKQAEEKKAFGAICAAPAVVLEAYGLLKGKRATCHPGFVARLSDQSAAKSRVVIDGLSITSRGPGTAMEFALSIVEQYFGEEKAESIAEAMVFQYPQ
ncbi:hypothetical protein GOP47_0014447 [Adiantum capillus-veneris]|uniref:DJ-1/PfpI domain-containing protein n=1 Tax=Adiantum capillus-veneris TaxID=13818 RepID=A0A9D4ZCG5_ADICA|nr:hypothetical protein GOP47_0014447 [Adiantum capillus-veneris]